MKRQAYWLQRKQDLQARKRELETYFQKVNTQGNLPYHADAYSLWLEYTGHGNYPYAGGYYDQPAKWRDDMTYVSAEVEYADIPYDIDKANEELSELAQVTYGTR